MHPHFCFLSNCFFFPLKAPSSLRLHRPLNVPRRMCHCHRPCRSPSTSLHTNWRFTLIRSCSHPASMLQPRRASWAATSLRHERKKKKKSNLVIINGIKFEFCVSLEKIEFLNNNNILSGQFAWASAKVYSAEHNVLPLDPAGTVCQVSWRCNACDYWANTDWKCHVGGKKRTKLENKIKNIKNKK